LVSLHVCLSNGRLQYHKISGLWLFHDRKRKSVIKLKENKSLIGKPIINVPKLNINAIKINKDEIKSQKHEMENPQTTITSQIKGQTLLGRTLLDSTNTQRWPIYNRSSQCCDQFLRLSNSV